MRSCEQDPLLPWNESRSAPTGVGRNRGPCQKLGEVIRQHRGNLQAALIAELNPIVRGWSAYYRTCVAKRAFNRLDSQLHYQLYRWATYRHPHKTEGWRYRRYWRKQESRMAFSDGVSTLALPTETSIRRHTKVRGEKTPDDGEWAYWGQRLRNSPATTGRVSPLLKQQANRCDYCGLRFMAGDVLEVHHRDRNRSNNAYINLALLHGYCHEVIPKTRNSCKAIKWADAQETSSQNKTDPRNPCSSKTLSV